MRFFFRGRAGLVGAATALVIAGCNEKAAERPRPGPWRIERAQAGDTNIVRNLGTNSSEVNATLTREAEVRGSGPDSQPLGRVARAHAAPDKGVILTEHRPDRLERFDSLGRFVRAYGSRGTGPGQFIAAGAVALDGNGMLHHLSVMPSAHAVYDPDGKISKTTTVPKALDEWHLNDDGSIHRRAFVKVKDSLSGGAGREMNALLHLAPDGSVLDTVFAPAKFGTHLETSYSWEGVPSRYPTPLTPRFELGFGAPGVWVFGNSERYSIYLQKPRGAPLRIDSDLSPVPVPMDERRSLADYATTDMRGIDRRARLRHNDVPASKPFYKNLRIDSEGRVWVELYQPATRVMVKRCPPSILHPPHPAINICADSSAPREMEGWVEPVVYDVFSPSGEMLGRVSLPAGATLLDARGDAVWLGETGRDDAARVARYRVSFPKRAAAISA